MSRQIEDELQKFHEGIGELRKIMNIEEVCEYGYTLTPRKSLVKVPGDKKLALTVSGIVHGNETVGLAVLNEFIHLLLTGTIDCRIPMGLFLGNVPAARANTRFVERDLNRCFGRESIPPKTAEEKRALALSPLLKESMWYFDMHQTNRPAEEPFFIFPYAKDNFFFAQNLSSHTAIVTHINSNFSSEGLCTDEYVNRHGGIGITLECGKAGFDPLQIGFGLKTLLHTVRFVHSILETHKAPHHPSINKNRKIFVVRDTISCPQTGSIKLAEGLCNLQTVEKGDHLATIDGEKIFSPRSGRIVFPNYAAEIRPPGQRPGELMRIVEAIQASELP